MRRRNSAALIFLALGACAEKGVGDLEQFIAEVNSRPPGVIEPIPAFKTSEVYMYQDKGLRDPFLPKKEKTEIAETNGLQPDLNRTKEELESFELDQLRMVGTIVIDDEMWGLVQDGGEMVHRVQPGHFIGKNYGKIVRLEDTKISVVELVRNQYNKQWVEREASLVLIEEEIK